MKDRTPKRLQCTGLTVKSSGTPANALPSRFVFQKII